MLDLEELRTRLRLQLDAGLEEICALIAEGKPLFRSSWERRVEKTCAPGSSSPDWGAMWKFLIKVPEVAQVHEQSLIQAEESLRDVLPAGAVIRIEIRRQHSRTSAKVVLGTPLVMKRGKEGRLECAPVKAALVLRVNEIRSAEAEAHLLGVRLEDVVVDPVDREVRVSVSSLNQAYTFASQRLEPERRSHTGRIFDLLLWEVGDDIEVALEEVRVLAEAGEWPLRRRELTERVDFLRRLRP